MKEILVIRDAKKLKEGWEPSREKILKLLAIKEMAVEEIAKVLDKDLSTIYRHIKRLEEAGLVEVSREERVGPVSKKYYQKAAKIIIGLIPPENTPDAQVLWNYTYEEIRKGLLALKGFKYNMPEDDAALEKLADIAVRWEKMMDSCINVRVDEEKFQGGIPAYDTALKLLVLVETRKNPLLRSITERLVTEISKYRRKP